MVFYVERKRRRPEGLAATHQHSNNTTTTNSDDKCQLFECEASEKKVRLVPKPPVFNLTLPPSPFGLLASNYADNHKNGFDSSSRDKFLLFYLNHDQQQTATNSLIPEDIRDKCNNLKIQILAGSSSPSSSSSAVNEPSILKSSSGVSSDFSLPSSSSSSFGGGGGGNPVGYNYIRSKIINTNDASNGESGGRNGVNGSSIWPSNRQAAATSRNETLRGGGGGGNGGVGVSPIGVSSSSSHSNSSNLFSSFLYSFSILFVLFIFVFFIYLYYSR